MSVTIYLNALLFPQNIFQGKDIREQLPHECKEFEDISSSWKTIMGCLHKDKNALQGTHQPGMTCYFKECALIKTVAHSNFSECLQALKIT